MTFNRKFNNVLAFFTLNVKQYCIQNIGLREIYEAVTSTKLNTEDERPLTICFICRSQLQRCFNLATMSRRAEQTITDLANNGMEVTQQKLSMFNLGMLENLKATTIELLTIDSNTSTDIVVKEEPSDQHEEKHQIDIKIEKLCIGVCRVCLTGNVRTHCIEDIGLVEIFEKVTNTKLYTEDGRPVTICYICRSQLQRCRTFCQMSRKAEQIFTELLNNGTQITSKIALKLNIEIRHNLSVNKTQLMSLDNFVIGKITLKAVKREFNVKPERKLKNNIFTAIKINPNYICQVCGKNYKAKQYLLEHLQSHSASNTLSCDLCTKTFNTKQTLRAHLRRHNLERYVCDVCSKVFRKKETLRNHMRRHTGFRPFACNICDKTFIYKGFLQQHILTHTGEKPYSCKLCNNTFSNKNSLQSHISTHTGRNICIQCNKPFRSKQDLQRHNMIHTGKKPYACNICDKAFYDNSSLKIHTRKHTGEKPFKCKRCGRRFADESNMLRHVLIHTGERPFPCNQCSLTFSRNYTLKAHMRLHSGIRPYTCNKCSKPYNTNKDLIRHMKTHTELKKKTCTNEQTSMFVDVHLKRSHTGTVVSFICNTCNKAFKKKVYLKRHLRIHTGEKPYACDQCSKTFYDHAGCYRHKKTHSGEKLLACNICDKRFARQYSLQRHMKTHKQK